MDSARLLERIREAAHASGVAGLGVGDAAPFPEARTTIEARVDGGLHAGMRFTFADPATSTDPAASFPWATRLVTAAWPYLPGAGDPGPPRPGTGRIARFATEDHYRGLRSALERVARMLEEAGHRTAVLVDDNRLVDRAAAVRSGVGWWGKNTMVLAPGAGPWLLLGTVVTDAPLPTTPSMQRNCGTCTACLPACPTGALVAPGVLDARLCLAHLLQAPGVFPRHLRRAAGDRVYGCDDCLDACPPGIRSLRGAVERRGRIDLIGLLAADDRTLLDTYAHFYVPRRRARYLRRNALIALGNSGGRDAVPVAAGYLGHPDWLLRAHAAWALGRLGGPMARTALAFALRRERHDGVTEEIRAALDGGGDA
jgi:epoxyqueuosine reductase